MKYLCFSVEEARKHAAEKFLAIHKEVDSETSNVKNLPKNWVAEKTIYYDQGGVLIRKEAVRLKNRQSLRDHSRPDLTL